ncbi:MAG: hypothetical protein OEM78_16845 [Gammaproteobacteria bacterium]|nr:hypothetical protein [Gammaproteobacteria bacterium]
MRIMSQQTTIIHDAVLKRLEQERAARRDTSHPEESSESGRWQLLRELQANNTEFERLFRKDGED